MATPDPFLFLAYHKDMYPAGNDKMEAPRQGNGSDFNPNAPYRMYHGDKIPGFPQHPHRGFETLTATIEGYADHSDSLGGCGRYGQGDLQWMTAGAGIVHGEMFPLIHQDKPNTLKLFQIWLNLPRKKKMAKPSYVMNWAENRTIIPGEHGAQVTLFAGELLGKKGGKPAPDSYANEPDSDVGVYYVTLPAPDKCGADGEAAPLASFKLPAAKGARGTNRWAYVVEGSGLMVDDQKVPVSSILELDASKETVFISLGDSTEAVELLILQGKPLNEPVAQQGPFVMNTREEIFETFQEYQRTKFGGWPWPQDAMIFPRDKGRFAVMGKGLPEEYPPGTDGRM